MLSLEDLGYVTEEIRDKATKFGVSDPFRLLSEEGSEILLETARRLNPFSRRAGNQIENMVRGGCYRSRWPVKSVKNTKQILRIFWVTHSNYLLKY